MGSVVLPSRTTVLLGPEAGCAAGLCFRLCFAVLTPLGDGTLPAGFLPVESGRGFSGFGVASGGGFCGSSTTAPGACVCVGAEDWSGLRSCPVGVDGSCDESAGGACCWGWVSWTAVACTLGTAGAEYGPKIAYRARIAARGIATILMPGEPGDL